MDTCYACSCCCSCNPLDGFSRNLFLLIRNVIEDGAIPIYYSFYGPDAEGYLAVITGTMSSPEHGVEDLTGRSIGVK